MAQRESIRDQSFANAQKPRKSYVKHPVIVGETYNLITFEL